MMWRTLQPRDYEILRTLLRLHFVTTRDIVRTFFASPTLAHRRLRRLSGLDLIASHRKGVPEQAQYSAWRLTHRGIDVVAEAFPEEPVGDGLADRLIQRSLYDLDHRAALTRVYLALLSGRSGPMPEHGSIAEIRAAVAAQRARAGQVWWQPDGDAILRINRLGEEGQIVPDAVVSSRYRLTRVFVEMDRATRGLARIREALERYGWFFEHEYKATFPDERAPALLYVVPSLGRKPGIAELAGSIIGFRARWNVLAEGEAPAWLEEQLIDPDQDAPAVEILSPSSSSSVPLARLRRVAGTVYHSVSAFDRQLRAAGQRLPEDARAALLDLYRELQGGPADVG